MRLGDGSFGTTAAATRLFNRRRFSIRGASSPLRLPESDRGAESKGGPPGSEVPFSLASGSCVNTSIRTCYQSRCEFIYDSVYTGYWTISAVNKHKR
jgi:hypothetical protein